MKPYSPLIFHKIIKRRDARFDGRFYFGVKTTGIYCRPICPAKPKPENIVIFKSKAHAELAGYRPCLRCKPDFAPGSKILQGTGNTVNRALRMLEEETQTEITVRNLSLRLGVSERHLRRLFETHLGASPIDILTSQRLHLARTLVVETNTPLSTIAFAVGFQSIRRFNEAFKELYQKPPSFFRQSKSFCPTYDSFRIKIPYRRPYDFSTMFAYLKRHEAFGIERVSKQSYTRFIPLKTKGYGEICLNLEPTSKELSLSLRNIKATEIKPILTQIKRLFDLDHNPRDLPKSAYFKTSGIRVPGCYDAYETVISILLSQRVSTENAKAKLKQLIERFGTKLGEDDLGPIFRFPDPSILKDQNLGSLGVTLVQERAIREVSRQFVTGELRLSQSADLDEMKKKLSMIPGVGPWSTEVIAMRCLADSDAFPANDLIIKRTIEILQWNEEGWESFRSYLTHCIWRTYGGKQK
jgi:AraC family transcriptional regulator of adaptative response / DNA-3-methyladenine glycosylase II